MVMSEVFWSGITTSLIGFILAMGSQCYKSKCKSVKICCIKVIRDVEGEEELDIQRPRNPIQSQNDL